MEMEQNIFFDEFKSKLISLENALIDVKNGNDDIENINEIFRAIHTVKGTADLLGMFDVVALSHKAEDILNEIRDGKYPLDDKLCSLFLEFKDLISMVVYNISCGIFDDSVTENLFIYFEKEFTKIMEKDSNEIVDIKTILVVEESTIVRYMIKKIATDNGYSVLTSDNSFDGIKKIRENEIDLLLCDLSGSNIDNIEMIEELRIDSKYKSLPIVMILTKENKNIQQLGKDLLAKAWLLKPIDETKLLVVLDKLLN